ncbi:MAG TPA: peptidoglycan DD-metalloendopeptidase family protein [Ramlibacter sp.]|nr:peptidoglycan DD-metalloendopeptidase family protein [Ramlibacter sp.]
MLELLRQPWKLALVMVTVGVMAGCASSTRAPAPVEDRSAATRVQPGTVATETPARLPPGAENAGKPGYYTVRPGDTLIRVALESGQNWRDIVRWNSIDNPNRIEVGQVLRIVAPVSSAPAEAAASRSATSPSATPSGVTSAPVAPASVAQASPLPPASAALPASAAASGPMPEAPPRPPVVAAAPPATGAPAVPAADEDVAWSWPAPGNTTVLTGFDEIKNKGFDIAGKTGDPVLASADGRVVYAGAGLRGYGNLVILKHNNTYLTAYAHNQTLLVKEDQTVRKGQKIAEMGSSDADRVKLHFEIRRQGKPVDPARYLQAR